MVLSDLSIRRPVLAIVVNLVVVLIGIIAYTRLPVRLIPNVDVPVVTVSTSYPGASAQVIESQVTQPIEDALSGVEGIEYMQSVSREQSSQVTIRFRLNRDPDGAASDVRDRVAQARQYLPEEVNEPIIQKQEADQQPIIYLAFSSDRHSQVEIADYAETLVKDRVQTIPGVAQAQVYSSTYAMRVWLNPQRLAGYGLTPADVENALRKQNVEIPAGRVEGNQREFTVLSETDLKTPEQFGNVILGDVGGTLVRLRDVAKVELGQQGRLTEPLHRPAGEQHYRPITWDDAYGVIADALADSGDPDRAVFYTSGRTSNEAAFLYQLLVRRIGTNNGNDLVQATAQTGLTGCDRECRSVAVAHLKTIQEARERRTAKATSKRQYHR